LDSLLAKLENIVAKSKLTKEKLDKRNEEFNKILDGLNLPVAQVENDAS
jgi:hypothetical protein